MERLGYSEDEALRRVRVARMARKLPRVLEELRSGALHLTGLFLLLGYLTEQNAEALLAEARGLSRRELERLLARWFPRPDTGTRIQPMMELSLLSPGFGSPSGHRPASSSAIGPSHSGTGRPTGWSSLATFPATGQSPVATCPEPPEQGHSLGGPPTRPVDTCPEQGNAPSGSPTRPVDTCPEQGNSLGSMRCVHTCPEQGNSLGGSS